MDPGAGSHGTYHQFPQQKLMVCSLVGAHSRTHIRQLKIAITIIMTSDKKNQKKWQKNIATRTKLICHNCVMSSDRLCQVCKFLIELSESVYCTLNPLQKRYTCAYFILHHLLISLNTSYEKYCAYNLQNYGVYIRQKVSSICEKHNVQLTFHKFVKYR